MTSDLGQRPGSRTPIILASYADDARYFAVREEKRIFLSAPALNEARVHGDEYLRALTAHEFTHVVTYWATRGWLWDPGEWAGAGLMPSWFVEGIAQAEAYTFSLYGGFLILRAAALEDTFTPLAKIDTGLATDQVDRWLTYAQGYSLVSYIAETYGKQALADILDNFAKYRAFEYALQRSLGLTEPQLFQAWQANMRQHYQATGAGKNDPPPAVSFPLEATLSARISPDGSRIALLGVQDWDLEDPYALLYLANRDGSQLRPLAKNVGIFSSAKFAWSPDSKTLYFTGKRILPNGTVRSALYMVNVETGGSHLLTPHLRASDPDLSPDGSRLAFVVYQDDATLLAISNADGSDLRLITSPQAPYQAFSPSWSPDGQWITFNCVWADRSAIALIRPDGSDFHTLTSGKSFDIEPRFSPNGSSIAYVSYAGGIPNVWVIPADGSQRQRVTNLAAASAFYPCWSPEGDALYFIALKTREATLVVADPKAVVGEVLGPEEPAEFSPPADVPQYPVRAYRPLGNFRRYITRTMNTGDGMGTTAGLLTEFADPLRQHALSAYTEYGLDSKRPRLDLQYTNSQLFTDLSLRYLDEIASPRGVGGAAVWDRRRALVLGLRLPANKTGELYRRESTSVTLSSTHVEPVRTSAPVVPPPSSGTITAMTLTWRRSERLPRQHREAFTISASSLGYALGGEIDATHVSAQADWAWEIPDVRHQGLLTVAYRLFDGEDLEQNPLREETIFTNLAFRRRLANDMATRLWPFFYSGPLALTFGWERRALLSGATGAQLGNTFRAELLSRGEISRYAPYQLVTGVSYNDRVQDTNFYLQLTTTPLTQPLREDETISAPPLPHLSSGASPVR